MFSTMVIALYEPTSPLRCYMSQHRGSLGETWTQKHGMKFVVLTYRKTNTLSRK